MVEIIASQIEVPLSVTLMVRTRVVVMTGMEGVVTKLGTALVRTV